MVKQVFINLSVAHLNKSITFFTSLGFSLNPQMSDAADACIDLDGHGWGIFHVNDMDV